MTNRNVIMLIDVGFLWKALLLHFGKTKRNEVTVDYASLCQVLADLAEEDTAASLLRQVWYDAARARRPTGEHRTLSAIAGVHVRLGWIVDTSTGPVQKAVDTAIVRDLVTAAHRHSADELVLLAGDGDLVPGIAEAADFGIKINLWGVSIDDSRVRQSDELVALADRRLTLDLKDLEAHAQVAGAPAPDDVVEFAVAIAQASDEDATGSAIEGSNTASAPIATSVPIHTDDVGRPVVLDLPASPPGADARLGPPPLSGLAEPAQLEQWETADTAEPMSPKTFGRRYGARWNAVADTPMKARLRDIAQSPHLPRLLEADLLSAASNLGLDSTDPGVRHGLRAGFWEGIEGEIDGARTNSE